MLSHELKKKKSQALCSGSVEPNLIRSLFFFSCLEPVTEESKTKQRVEQLEEEKTEEEQFVSQVSGPACF